MGKKRAGRLLDGREHNELPWAIGPRKPMERVRVER
jgi:hypothetical protein